MKRGMFIVKHGETYHGPFVDFEAEYFVSTLSGDAEILPLRVPRRPDEFDGKLTVRFEEDDAHRARVDSFKVDTRIVFAAVIQSFMFARRDERVLTVREIREDWEMLYQASQAFASLMHHAEQAIGDPTPDNLTALRKAFWRNRDSDDVDPHYWSRFW
jgi:hypothetical protein